jgi:hypothetical protein
MDFVHQTNLKALFHHARSTDYDVLLPCDLLRLFNRAFNTISHKGEGRSWFVYPFLQDMVGEDDDRNIHRMFTAPSMSDVERPAIRHQDPCLLAGVLDQVSTFFAHHECAVATR